MSALMILTAWIFVAPEIADAATPGNYRIFIGIQVTNGSGSEHEDELYVKVTYDKNDGSGSAQTGDLLDHSQCWGPDEWSNHYANIDTTIPGFPTRIDVCVNMKGVGFLSLDTDALTIYVQSIKIYNYKTGEWAMLWEGSVKFDSERNEYKAHWDREGHHNDNRTSRDWETYTPYYGNWDSKPAANYVEVSGPDSVSVNTDGSTTNYSSSAYSAVVKDQWGVNWREDPTGLVIDSNSYGITLSSKKVAVPATANRSSNYTVTVRGQYNSISGTKTVTINTFDYKVTFYDENGTTVLKATQTIDYGGSATAPSNPTKDPDSSKHYTFNSWIGDGYTNITSGAQTKTVKASYTGTAHTATKYTSNGNKTHKVQCNVCNYTTSSSVNCTAASSWTTDGNQHWKKCTVCQGVATDKTNHSATKYTSNGNKTHKIQCSVCDYTTNSSTACTAASSWTTDGNQHWKKCTVCQGVATDKTNHTATKYTSNGNKTHKIQCSVCDYTTSSSTSCTAASSWTTDGSQHWKKCTVCQGVATDKTNHTATKYTSNGNKTHKIQCSVCDYTTSSSTACTAVSAWTTDGSQHWKKCTVCNGVATDKTNHSGGTATCVAAASCSTCQAAYGSVNSNNHDYKYDEAVFNWNGFACPNATVTCSRASGHTKTENTTVTSEVTSEPTYSQDGEREYTAKFTENGTDYTDTKTQKETVPALDELITVPTVVNKLDSNTGSTSFALTSTPESGITYSVVGLASAAPSNPDALAKSAPGTTNSINGHQGTISIDDGTISYTLNKMTFTQVEEFYAVVKVEGVLSHKYDGNSVYTYEKVTIVPSQTVLFDDEFSGITFGPNGKWTTTNSSTVNNAGDGAGQVTENEGDSVLYSLGSIHKVNVSAADAASWPTAEFTFTGTGFDLISVTSNDSGVFSYSIYEAGTNNYAVDSNGKRYAKNKLVDTYYGYTYGDLYWNAATRKIVGSGGAPLYVAKSNCPDDKKIETGNGNFVYTTDLGSAVSSTQAKGWLETTSGVNGLYQIPVISRNDLPYGTYRVVVTAMYNQNFAHNNSKSYNLYIDGVRIYNPAQGNETAQTKYNTDGESNPVYTSFRNALNDGYVIAISGGNKLYEDGADNNGIDKNTMSLEAYLKGSPNNELYLLPGGTISFDINGNAYEAIKIGAKSVDGSATTMGVAFGNGTRSFSVNTATEKYYSVKDLIDDSSGTVTITNNGSGILSLTKLMTSVKPSQSSHAPARIMSVSESTFDEALELLEMTEADIAIDEETIETTSSDDGTVTITLQTGEDAQTIVIRDADGNVVEPDSIDFTIDEEGIKNWTIVLTEEAEGEFTYTLQAEYENGYTGETEPTTVTVTVSFPEPEDSSIGGRLDKIKGFFERLIEFIRRIINLFR